MWRLGITLQEKEIPMNELKLHKVQVLALSVVVLAGVALLLSAPYLSAWTPEEEEEHRLAGYHTYQIDGLGQFSMDSSESIAAVSEEKFLDRNGLSNRSIRILGMAGRGYSDGIGETMYWLDKSRPVEGSGMRAKARGAEFPAVHEMRFHLLLTTEALPGRTLRSVNPAVMVNNNATSFPPRMGSRYVLKNVIELEDVDNPGVVVGRILSNRNKIVGSRRYDSGEGVRPPA
jgi:hypothetical protein